MKLPRRGLTLACALLLIACSTGQSRPPSKTGGSSDSDPYAWLEEIESSRAMDWVQKRNAAAEAALKQDPLYAPLRESVHAVLVAKDRIPAAALRGDWVFNFWQDAEHVKGVWRRARLAEYAKPEPAWETILDLDALAKQESESWVWKGASCLPPAYSRCLLRLSRGGKDAVVVREFDIGSRGFVAGGFELPEAKSRVSWMGADAVWVGTDFGPGSLTRSGYPRVVKAWKRGTPLGQAKTVFEGVVTDVSVEASTSFFADRPPVHLISRAPSFFESENFVYSDNGQASRIPFPKDAEFRGVFGGYALASLRSQWRAHKQGSLVALALDRIGDEKAAGEARGVETVYAPDDRSTLVDLDVSRDGLYLQTLTDVQGRILKATRSKSGRWALERRPFPDRGVVSMASADPFASEVLISYESFLEPTTLYFDGGASRAPRAIKRLPARFDASAFEVKQHWAVSRDGTRVPYYVVGKKGMRLDRSTPTLLYGYGGFEVSMTPSYLSAIGKAWLERGGAYALASIRGGGEFGPRWHEAAILSHRQRAYDDFIAVAADLNRLKIAKPERIGIMGGSNGGLLMGVMLTQRPDLFGAVVCQVPLLDMLKYHRLLAGASWMGEYGDPEDPGMGPVLAGYSPYHNVKRELKYPRVLIETSTRDDRVHPGHARKMVAKLEELGKEVLYFENIEGGHSAAADLEQRATRTAMEFTYLWQQLGK